MQPNKSDKLGLSFCFYGPETPTALGDKCLTTISQRVTFCACKQRRKELHNFWVSVKCCERFPVCGTPLTQPKALCVELNWLSHFLPSFFLMRHNVICGADR